jgi:hypothetical protein
MAIQNKLGIKKPTLPTPDYTEYYEYLSVEFDFLDDSTMYPSNESFETVSTGNMNGTGRGEGDWETTHRVKRDTYLKYKGECMIDIWNRAPISTKEIGISTYNGFYTTWTNEEPSIPTGENTIFFNFPLKKVKCRHRISMLESAKLFDGFNDYVYYVNNIDENGQWVSSPITDELDNAVTNASRYEYLVAKKANGDSLTEEEETELTEKYQDFVNKYTNPNYYPSTSWTGEGAPSAWGPNGINRAGRVLGVNDLNWLPSINRVRDLPVTGNPGDAIYVRADINGIGYTTFYWNQSSNKWWYNIIGASGDIEDNFTYQRAFRDAKIKAFNELLLSTRPFTWAAYHIPKYKIERDIL